MFDTLVGGECGVPGPLKYLLSYKFSQDHIELFFCAVRAYVVGEDGTIIPPHASLRLPINVFWYIEM